MPTLTTAQMDALQLKLDVGNTAGFYNDLEGIGDTYGRLAGGITGNNTWQGQLANTFAASAAARSGVDLSYGSTAWTNLNLALAQAYLQEYRNNAGSAPTRQQIQDFHNFEFDDINISENAWFPNKLLNDSATPDADWDDFQENIGPLDLLQDAYGVLQSTLLNGLDPASLMSELLTDPQGLADKINFSTDFLNALAGMDRSSLQDMANDLTGGLIDIVQTFIDDVSNAFDQVQDWFENLGGGSGGGGGGGAGGWEMPCWIGCDTNGDGIFDTGVLGGWPNILEAISPLVLDLDASGTIDLTSIANSVAFFDLDQDGMAENVGWVQSTDGLLAIDLNSDGVINSGAELFGDATTDGFTILAGYDSNNDGKIDSNDSVWADLLVWQDANEDGYSQSAELHTLDVFNITEFDLAGAVELSSPQDNQGNAVTHTGTFTVDDGSGPVSRIVHDVWFDVNQTFSRFVEPMGIDVRTLFLPTLRGFGNLKDLYIAMREDNTGTDNLLDQVVALNNTSYEALFEFGTDQVILDILYRWAGVDPLLATDARGDNLVDAKHLEFIEEVIGEEFLQRGWHSNPLPFAAAGIEEEWDTLYQKLKALLLAQAGAETLFSASDVTYNLLSGDLESATFDLDQTAITALKDHALTLIQADKVEFWKNVAHFMENTKGDVTDSTELGWLDTAVADSLTTGLADWGDVTALIADTSFNVIDGDVNDNVINGTVGADDIRGYDGNDAIDAKEGDDKVIGGLGNDTILGDSGNDNLDGQGGIDTIDGGSGNDEITGGSGDDILTGGSGGDTVRGESGNDTYIYTSGNDAFSEFSFNDTGDVLKMGAGIVASDLTFFRTAANDLYITVAGKGEIQIEDHFAYPIETLTFTESGQTDIDLTNLDDVITYGSPDWDFINGVSGGNQNDTIYGYAGNDNIVAGTGDDLIYGGDDHDDIQGLAGSDTLYGESGNDDIHGGNDNDFIYGGDGNDIIESWNGDDYVEGGDGDDVIKNNAGNDEIYGGGGNDTITAKGGDDEIHGGDGNDAIISGSGEDLIYGDDGDDVIDAGADADVVYGGLGNDTIEMGNANSLGPVDYGYGGAGDDIITGGSYEHRLYGEAGNDTLDGGNHDDFLYGGDDNDVLIGGDGWDELYGEDGDDALEGNRRDDLLDGGLGNDTAIYSAAPSAVTVNLSLGTASGGDGSDTLVSIENVIGSAFNDTLIGSVVANILNGAVGDDVLQGGTGDDEYIFNAGNGQDTITDTDGADDFIRLGPGIVAANLTLTDVGNNLEITFAGNATDKITIIGHNGIGTQQIEKIIFDDLSELALVNTAPVANDDSATTDQDVAVIIDVLANDSDADLDTLSVATVGSAANGAAVLNGDNTITYTPNSGYSGADSFTYNVDDGNGGTDTATVNVTVNAAITYNVINGTTANNTINGTSGNDEIHGMTGHDYLYGLGNGDILFGENGHDYLYGGDGDDTLYAGDVNGQDDNSNHLYGDAGDDILYAASIGGDRLYGGSGNDILHGNGGGYDRLYGDAGDDTLFADNGTNGEFHGGADIDTVVYNADSAGFVLYRAQAGQLRLVDTNGTYGENIIIYDDVESLQFSDITLDLTSMSFTVGGAGWGTTVPKYLGSGNQTYTAYPVASEIHGGLGADTITGSQSDDTLFGDNGHDYLYGGDGNDTLYAGDVNGQDDNSNHLYGDAGDDILYAASIGGDRLYGGSGNDILHGNGGGHDRLYGDAGNDTLHNDSGTDGEFQGGADSDTVVYNVNSAGFVLYRAQAGQLRLVDTNGTYGENIIIYDDVENLQFSDLTLDLTSLTFTVGGAGWGTTVPKYLGSGSDTYTAYPVASEIHGMAGHDTITGSHADDILYGETGHDYLYGGDGNDTLYAGDVNGQDDYSNHLYGDAGDDILYGGNGGLDNLYGGIGADTFVFKDGVAFSYADRINDFSTTEGDSIDVSDILTGYDPLADLIADFVQITDNGTDSFLAVDPDGGADNFVQIATLANVTGLTDEAALVTSGNLIAA